MLQQCLFVPIEHVFFLHFNSAKTAHAASAVCVCKQNAMCSRSIANNTDIKHVTCSLQWGNPNRKQSLPTYLKVVKRLKLAHVSTTHFCFTINTQRCSILLYLFSIFFKLCCYITSGMLAWPNQVLPLRGSVDLSNYHKPPAAPWTWIVGAYQCVDCFSQYLHLPCLVCGPTLIGSYLTHKSFKKRSRLLYKKSLIS